MCKTEIIFANSLLQKVKFEISHADANAKNSHLFAKYAKNSHIFAKLYIFVIGLYLCIISYYIAIISQINANFMWIFIIGMQMQNLVSMHISQSSKKCYEILHILGFWCYCKNIILALWYQRSGPAWSKLIPTKCLMIFSFSFFW